MSELNRYGTAGREIDGRACCGHNVPLAESCRPCGLLFLADSAGLDGSEPPTLAGQTDYGASISIPRDAAPRAMVRIMAKVRT